MPSLIKSLEKLVAALQRLTMTPAELLYEEAYNSIGKDLSIVADNEVACSEVVSRIIQKTFPEMKFPTLISTRELFAYLSASPSFQEVTSPSKGCIILAVSGTGNGLMPHGHTGIVGKTWIMSNDSRSGSFEPNYILESWDRYYRIKGGFFSHFFRPV